MKIIAYNITNCTYYILNYNYKEVISYCVGGNTAYFVNENQTLIGCTLSNLNEGQIELNTSIVMFPEDKKIVSVNCGLYYFIIMTR